jgi:hypothetical protein
MAHESAFAIDAVSSVLGRAFAWLTVALTALITWEFGSRYIFGMFAGAYTPTGGGPRSAGAAAQAIQLLIAYCSSSTQ